MFYHHPFWEHEAAFVLHVRSAQEGKVDSLMRHVTFARLAHDMLGWFLEYPKLASVQLTAVALAEFEDDRHSVRIRHHFKLTNIGAEVSLDERYFGDNLPWPMIGSGVFLLERGDAAVQSFLALSAQDAKTHAVLDYPTMAYALALRIDRAFTEVSIRHNLGLAPSFD